MEVVLEGLVNHSVAAPFRETSANKPQVAGSNFSGDAAIV